MTTETIEQRADTFSERFKLARENTGLTLSKLAEQVGTTTQAIWNYENRPDGSVAVEFLFPLADALGVNARWLATGVSDETFTAVRLDESIIVTRIARNLAALPDERLKALAVVLAIKL